MQFNKKIWAVLKTLKEELDLQIKDEPISFRLQTGSAGLSTDELGYKLLRKLEHEGLFKIEFADPQGEAVTLDEDFPWVAHRYLLEINKEKFREQYNTYYMHFELTEPENKLVLLLADNREIYYQTGGIYIEGIKEKAVAINRNGLPRKLWDYGLKQDSLKFSIKKALGKQKYNEEEIHKNIREHRETLSKSISKTAKKHKLDITEDFIRNHLCKEDSGYLFLAKA